MEEPGITNPQPAPTPQPVEPPNNLPTDQTVPANLTLQNNDTKKSKRSKYVLPLIAGAVLLVGGGAAAYNATLQNSPDKIWDRALSNTAEGFSTISEKALKEPVKGGQFEGAIKISGPAAVDGTVKGEWYETNVSLKSNIGFSGVRANAELRSIKADDAEYPDIYLKVDGLESLQSLIGQANPEVAQLLSSANGNWYVIDRTLIEQGVSSVLDETSTANEVPMLSEEDLRDISTKTSDSLKEYLFTTNSDKAVVQIADMIGEEEFDGKNTYKYELTVNKENLKKFLNAYKDSLKETQLDEYVIKNSGDNKSFEEIIEFNKILEDVDKIDFSKTKNEAWVDLDTKLIRNIRITPTDQDAGTTGYIEFAMPYDGGDELTFSVNIVNGADAETGNDLTAKLTATFNQKNDSVDLGFDVFGTMDDQEITAKGNMKVTPSGNQIQVEKPENAKNILELVGAFNGLSGQPGLPAEFGSDTNGDSRLQDYDYLYDNYGDDIELN